jgi:hypothetical protein
MDRVKRVTFSTLRVELLSSPTGVVIYPTEAGWQVRKDDAALFDEHDKGPRVWKDLDRAVTQLKGLGVRSLELVL